MSVMGAGSTSRSLRPRMALSELDARTRFLQANAIERSTSKGYRTGARDYVTFCLNHDIPLDPTPETLSRYLSYTSQFISSGPKYLSGARHFLGTLYPSFDANRSHPLVQATIAGAKKIRADPVKRKLPLRQNHLVAFWIKHDAPATTTISCSRSSYHAASMPATALVNSYGRIRKNYKIGERWLNVLPYTLRPGAQGIVSLTTKPTASTEARISSSLIKTSPTLLSFSKTTQRDATAFMAAKRRFSSETMDLSRRVRGLIANSSHCWTANMVAILVGQAAPRFMLASDSPKRSYKPWVDGHLKRGRTIFVTIPPFAPSSSSPRFASN